MAPLRRPATKVVVFSRRTRSVRPAMPVRQMADESLAARAAAAQPSHVGRRSHFVDEDERLRVQRRLSGLPISARGSDVRPLLLAGVNGFF